MSTDDEEGPRDIKSADEFHVLKECANLIDGLKPEAQQRAVLYLSSRYPPKFDEEAAWDYPGAMVRPGLRRPFR